MGFACNSRVFQLFHLFDVHTSCKFSYFPLVWDGLERVLPGNSRNFIVLFGPTLAAMYTCVLLFKKALKDCKHCKALFLTVGKWR